MEVQDAIERLQCMVEPDQQTWDLSPNDVESIQTVLKHVDEHIHGPVDDAIYASEAWMLITLDDHGKCNVLSDVATQKWRKALKQIVTQMDSMP